MRDERPEKERYQHASLLEQLRDELLNLRRQPRLVLLLVILFGGFVVLKVLEPQVVQVEVLRVGDCLYVPNPGAVDAGTARPIGLPAEVSNGLLQAGAERAPCDGSHGHEVVAVFRFEAPADGSYPGPAVLSLRQEPGCEAAFASYVGRPREGSALELIVVVPREADWAKGRRAGTCLVGRIDGAFMDRTARGSGQ